MGIDWNSLMTGLAQLFASLLTGLSSLLGVDVPDMPLPVPRPDGPTVTAPIPGKPSVGIPDVAIPQTSSWLRPAPATR